MKDRTMTDAMGREVPVKYVSKYDRMRDAEVRRIVADWMKARWMLEDLTSRTLERIGRIVEARKDAGTELAARGNVQASNFDGLMTVACNVRYDIHLDDRVRQARDMLVEYARGLAGKLEGDDGKALLAILDETFRPAGDGRLSTSRVLSLLRMDVRSPKWRQAIELLKQSVETRKGKSYLRVTVKDSRQAEPRAIRLDVADCWPGGETGEAAATDDADGADKKGVAP